MNKQKIFLTTILVFAMLLAFLVPITSFADDENKIIFKTKTNTNLFNMGETVKATVKWEDNKGNTADVQAVGFTLQYDNNKLEFVDATFGEVDGQSINEKQLEEDFYNAETPGTIFIAKISLNDLNMSYIALNFRTIAQGTANINLTNVDCVANGNLCSPDSIDFSTNGLATAKILAFGDVDSNGTVENADITLINKYIEGTQEFTEHQLEVADVNLDGKVDEIDVELIQKFISSNIVLPIRYGDVNLDGKITVKDCIKLQQYIANNVELDETARINADANLDKLINSIDLNTITVSIAGWIDMPFKMIKNSNLKAVDCNKLNMITGFDLDKIKVSDLKECFDTDNGFEICNSNDEVLGNDLVFGTGTKVKIGKFGNNTYLVDGVEKSWVAEYNVVIYGDTTGDAQINAIDALALIKHLNGAIPFTNEAFTEAGRIVSEEGAQPTAVDALAIIKHANKKITISQTK